MLKQYKNALQLEKTKYADWKEQIKKVSDEIDHSTADWNLKYKEILLLFDKPKKDDILQIVALALSYHHMANESITQWLSRLSKLMAIQSTFLQDRSSFYQEEFPWKLSALEREIHIKADSAPLEHITHIIQAHIEYLRNLRDMIKDTYWYLKNKEHLGIV